MDDEVNDNGWAFVCLFVSCTFCGVVGWVEWNGVAARVHNMVAMIRQAVFLNF